MGVTKTCFIPPGRSVKMLWAKRRNTISLLCVRTTALSLVVNSALFALFEIIQAASKKKYSLLLFPSKKKLHRYA
jgi:hypothetical protein